MVSVVQPTATLRAWPTARPSRCSRLVVRAQTAIKIPAEFKQVIPKGQLVLSKVAETEAKTLGGILLPSSAQRAPTSGDVVAVGDGRLPDRTHEFTLSPGDTILYSKFGIGVTELEVAGEAHILIREEDVLGTLPSIGGVLLPDSARSKPLSGEVVAVGPGKFDKDGARIPPRLQKGDKVVYFKYAGDSMETPEGVKYVVLHEQDVLCKV
ncbi:CPN23 [Auxenochlorella protothecoides x Auxenochlorella symbiontica]